MAIYSENKTLSEDSILLSLFCTSIFNFFLHWYVHIIFITDVNVQMSYYIKLIVQLELSYSFDFIANIIWFDKEWLLFTFKVSQDIYSKQMGVYKKKLAIYQI